MDRDSHLSQSEADDIAAYLALDAPPKRADLAFVFGTRHPEPAHLAAGLYARGLAQHIVLTGGQGRTGVHEALRHLDILLAQGVPCERIVVEGASTNTLENVTLALPLLTERLDLDRVETIVVVTKWYHCRRAMMTLRQHLPEGIRYYTRIYEPDVVRRASWHLDPEATRRVLKEWHNIPRYLARGDIREVRRDGDAFV